MKKNLAVMSLGIDIHSELQPNQWCNSQRARLECGRS
jgi:hypothetical protein